MKIRTLVVSGLVFSLALGLASQAAWAVGEVKAREENQQKRISQGVQSGQLTTNETAKLDKMEDKIEANRQKALADGKVTPKEARKLNREENRTSRKIYQLKHNAKKA